MSYDQQSIARSSAQMLWEIQAVHFSPHEPYVLASGLKSPVYIDCRKIIAHPKVRTALMDYAVDCLIHNAGAQKFDGIAGGETAGIPFAAWIAERLNLPMLYVRKKPKGYGRNARIEGGSCEGQNILLVEDLTTDGGSKVSFCEGLREAGASVSDIFVIFYYDIFASTKDLLANNKTDLHYLTTWHDVLAQSRAQKLFDAQTLDAVEEFLADPHAWQQAH